MSKITLTEKDMARQTKYIIVNSNERFAYIDSVTEAQHYVKLDPKNKVIFTAPESMPFKEISSSVSFAKRGDIYKVTLSKGDNTPSATFRNILYTHKYGMIIVSSDNTNESYYNEFLTELFKRKSIDIIKHQPFLILSEPEFKLLQRSVNEAEEGKRISRNFAFGIYPDDSFKFDKETFEKLNKQHEVIDALGLMLTQYIVNSEASAAGNDLHKTTQGRKNLVNTNFVDKFIKRRVYYNYFTRIITDVSKTALTAGINYLTNELELGEDVYNYARHIWLGEELKPSVKMKMEENGESKKTESDKSVVDQLIDKIAHEALDKIQKEEINSEKEIGEFYIGQYEKKGLDKLIDPYEYTEKLNTKLKEITQTE